MPSSNESSGARQKTEAVLLAQIPQTARVDKKEVKAPEVEYQGNPEFQPIPETTVSRAVNTDKDIIKVGDLYYMCFQGVWFMGRSPNGPWEVTGSVPGQIYEIPVSSPSYNVTNVTVVEDNSDAVVFATAAAYTGLMIGWGCAVWGTGYYYPPYVGYGGFYPVYHPYYPTYGYHASYNPWTGSYSRGVAAYGPYGGAGVGARYNPRTGTYARGAAAYGPYGRARRRRRLQPAHGRVRRDETGLERLRQLGPDRRAARRSVGQHVARHQQPDRRDDARDAGQRRRRGGHQNRPAGNAAASREPAAATSTPAATATSTRRRAAAGSSTTTATATGTTSSHRSSGRDAATVGTAQSRFSGPRGRRAAHSRRQQRQRGAAASSSYRPSRAAALDRPQEAAAAATVARSCRRSDRWDDLRNRIGKSSCPWRGVTTCFEQDI